LEWREKDIGMEERVVQKEGERGKEREKEEQFI
jgi:hypothetical protein